MSLGIFDFFSLLCRRHLRSAGLKWNVLTDNISKAEVLSNHFQQNFARADISSIPYISCSNIPAMESVSFSRKGAINRLRNLDQTKANAHIN